MRSARTHENGCANEATTGLTLALFVMLFPDVVFINPPPQGIGQRPAK